MNYVTEAIARQPFTSKAEMDHVIKRHLGEHGAHLNDTAVDILRLLSRYAVKYPGVSFLKHATIAKAVGKSRITVIRNMKKLTDRRIIEKVSFTRPVNGGKGANLYVICPEVTPFDTLKATSTPIQREDFAEPTPVRDKTYYGGYEPLSYTKRSTVIKDNTYARTSFKPVYQTFKDAVSTFTGQGNQTLISKLYGVYLGQTKDLRNAYEPTELIGVAVEAINATMHASKSKNIRNIPGYFNGVLSQLLDRMGSELMAEMWAE